jgi:hypothetical protein
VRFGDFRYLADAISTYAELRAAKEAGTLADDSRLLVSIPTPLNTL